MYLRNYNHRLLKKYGSWIYHCIFRHDLKVQKANRKGGKLDLQNVNTQVHQRILLRIFKNIDTLVISTKR